MKSLIVMAALIACSTIAQAQYNSGPAMPQDRTDAKKAPAAEKSYQKKAPAKKHVHKRSRKSASSRDQLRPRAEKRHTAVPPEDDAVQDPNASMEDNVKAEQLRNIRESQAEEKKIRASEAKEMEDAQNRARSGVDTGKARPK